MAFAVSGAVPRLFAADAGGTRFDIQTNVVIYNHAFFTNVSLPDLDKFNGKDIALSNIVNAASLVLSRFEAQGYTNANVAIALDRITNGVLTMNVYNGVYPHVLISGQIFQPAGAVELTAFTNALAKTNIIPTFPILGYEVTGNTLLSDDTLESIFSKHVGTNETGPDIVKALVELLQEYRTRGYYTVGVGIPEAKSRVTNGIVSIEVAEGTLSAINVVNNRHFSSNNVMRALPSLKTNMILNNNIFQAELDRANANQDRQIYPKLLPGLYPNTSELDLVVTDRVPVHAKIELNNQNSPGTPDLRVNSSAVYNNLWQENHSFGVQYSFSPEVYKLGDQWGWYDRPLVANYSGFYRMPLGNPSSVADVVESSPGSFGFNEATRKFDLPPPSGSPELNLFASRSTIDTGVQLSPVQVLFSVPNVRTVTRQDAQQDLTINNDIGFRISYPLPQAFDISSTVSAGLDYKSYYLRTFKTNNFQFIEITLNGFGQPNPPVVSEVQSAVPTTYSQVHYLPIGLRWDGSRRDDHGFWSAGFGYNANLFANAVNNSRANFQQAAGSPHASGFYNVLTASISRDQEFPARDWRLVVRADGQWASEPLISNEQFGAGGVNSVRGYHEGEVFGDDGWHTSIEQRTPGAIIGRINGRDPLILRGSLYMDYAETYLFDPQGRDGRTSLWSAGVGTVASIGTGWEARFLFSLPLLNGPTIEQYHPYFNFSLTGQF